jgi:hypothetical protein
VHHDDEFDNVTDGVVYAAMVGLGFAMTENAVYYGRVWDTTSLSAVFVLRGLIGPFAHPLFTAMTGVGIGLARERHGASGTWAAPATGFTLAVLLHALWNAAASANLLFPTAYLIIMVPAFLAALVVVVRSTRREVAILRRHLGPLVEEGCLAAVEVETICTLRGRVRALLGALVRSGPRGFLRRRRFHDDLTHLAFQAWRLERGIDGDGAAAARRRTYEARVRAWQASGT